MSHLELSAEQARVIGALVEKSITTPQYYPLTVKALTAACNQKSCRNPVMALTDAQVEGVLRDLEVMQLVAIEEGGRARRWRHRFQHQMMLKAPALAVLATLMLRGPQTLAELRANASSLGGPEDVDILQDVLEDLVDRAQPLLRQLEKAPGHKEARYIHLLVDEADQPAPATGSGSAGLGERVAALEARVAMLEEQLRLMPTAQ